MTSDLQTFINKDLTAYSQHNSTTDN